MKLENSNCAKTKKNCEESKKHKLWLNSNNQIVMTIKNSSFDETQKPKL